MVYADIHNSTIQKSVRNFLWAPHNNFSTILTRFRDVAAFVLQHATFFHSTSGIPKISPCSPGSRWIMDDLWATKSEDVGLIVHAVSFQDFPPLWS